MSYQSKDVHESESQYDKEAADNENASSRMCGCVPQNTAAVSLINSCECYHHVSHSVPQGTLLSQIRGSDGNNAWESMALLPMDFPLGKRTGLWMKAVVVLKITPVGPVVPLELTGTSGCRADSNTSHRGATEKAGFNLNYYWGYWECVAVWSVEARSQYERPSDLLISHNMVVEMKNNTW